MQLRRWSTVSSTFKHIGQELTTTVFRCCKLSMMRIAPRRASQLKADTVGGAFDFQMLKIGLEYLNPSKRTEKKDATEKEPSADGAKLCYLVPHLEGLRRKMCMTSSHLKWAEWLKIQFYWQENFIGATKEHTKITIKSTKTQKTKQLKGL